LVIILFVLLNKKTEKYWSYKVLHSSSLFLGEGKNKCKTDRQNESIVMANQKIKVVLMQRQW